MGWQYAKSAPDKLPAFRNAEFVNVPPEQSPPAREPDAWEINARRLAP